MFETVRHFTSALVAATLMVTLVAPVPAQAQFGGLFKKRPPADQKSDEDGCANDAKSSIGKSILGNVIGDFTRRATRGMGAFGSFVPRAEVAETLTNSIACRLDPEEQLQAAEATRSVTESEQLGESVQWTSETRPGVFGSSTATSKSLTADGSSCMSITDVVIVDGEETRVSKRMCKAPGETRYIVVA